MVATVVASTSAAVTEKAAEQVAARSRELKERALALGFARVGVATAQRLEPEGEWLQHWLERQRHGDMRYMQDTAAVRLDPQHPGMLPAAASIVVVALPYRRDDAAVGPAPGRVARYARGRDYHRVLDKRLGKLATWLRQAGDATRVAVDRLPILERAWAQRAGLGFIGKNCCLIIPGLGSHVVLGALVTTARLAADAPMAERCGSCRLCLDACPTEAFVAPRQLDARRCISYLTIEHRGDIATELRPAMQDWIFGCDACQDVCPYNRTALPDAAMTQPFAPHRRWQQHDAAALLQMDEATFRTYAQGSPIQRPGWEGMARNAAIVLGNHGERRHLPVLQTAATHHPSAMVRDAAAWALQRLDTTTDVTLGIGQPD